MKSVTWKTATMHPIAPVAGLAMIAALGSSAMAQAPAQGRPAGAAPGPRVLLRQHKGGGPAPPKPPPPSRPAHRGGAPARPRPRERRPPPPNRRPPPPAARQADPQRFQQPAFRLGP